MLGVIGDVHGCVRTLDSLLDKLFGTYDIHKLIFLGDIINRGRNSKEVCDVIMELKKHYDVTLILGNHEDVMRDYFRSAFKYGPKQFIKLGGDKTVSSFSGGRLDKELAVGKDVSLLAYKYFEPYFEFFDSAVICDSVDYEHFKLHFSHAGLPDMSKNSNEDDSSFSPIFRFMWSRDCDRRKTPYFGYTMVHGHTPVIKANPDANPNKPYMNLNKKGEICSINLDTGCVYGYYLSAMIVDDNGDFEFESAKYRDKS
jgi:serine/threonine protein phosphatase 1